MSKEKRTTAALMTDFDLTAPLDKHEKPPKKNHTCPHDRKHPSGMEVCRECGDFGICTQCGDEYISRDDFYRSDELCYPCSEAERLTRVAERARADVAKRIAAHKAKETNA